jgi:prepilin-type N-terminal cleavage/methylation domain-containing protein
MSTRMHNPNRRPWGFTLIEMIITLGVGAIVTYGILTMLTNTTKSVTSLGGKNDFNGVVNEVGSVLNNADRCKAAFGASNSTIPPLGALGDFNDPGTQPLQIALNLGNADPKKGALTPPITVGSRFGRDLTVVKFEIMGKERFINSTLDPSGTKPLWTVLVHLVVSRRMGVTVTTGTGTGTGTSTGTGTGTSTGASISVNTAAGSEMAVGGDLLQHVFRLTATMDSAGNKIVGCNGQYENFWTNASTATSTTSGTATGTFTASHTGTSTSTSIAAVGALSIVYKLGNMIIWPDQSAAIDTSIKTDTQVPTAVKNVPWVVVGGAVHSQNGFVYRSDARLKENVREIPNAAERVDALHGVEYNWKQPTALDGRADEIGFLAQDVEKEFPEVVSVNPVSHAKMVSYESLVPPMIEAIKARQKVLLRQQREIDELKRALAERK